MGSIWGGRGGLFHSRQAVAVHDSGTRGIVLINNQIIWMCSLVQNGIIILEIGAKYNFVIRAFDREAGKTLENDKFYDDLDFELIIKAQSHKR